MAIGTTPPSPAVTSDGFQRCSYTLRFSASIVVDVSELATVEVEAGAERAVVVKFSDAMARMLGLGEMLSAALAEAV